MSPMVIVDHRRQAESGMTNVSEIGRKRVHHCSFQGFTYKRWTTRPKTRRRSTNYVGVGNDLCPVDESAGKENLSTRSRWRQGVAYP